MSIRSFGRTTVGPTTRRPLTKVPFALWRSLSNATPCCSTIRACTRETRVCGNTIWTRSESRPTSICPERTTGCSVATPSGPSIGAPTMVRIAAAEGRGEVAKREPVVLPTVLVLLHWVRVPRIGTGWLRPRSAFRVEAAWARLPPGRYSGLGQLPKGVPTQTVRRGGRYETAVESNLRRAKSD